MAEASRHEGDHYFAGSVRMATVYLPLLCVADAQVSATAAIDATKLEHQHNIAYGQANAAAVDETRVIYVCRGATGTVMAVKAGSIAAAVGDANCTVDVKKNGTTILTAPITLDSSNAAYTPEAGTVSVSGLVAGDVLTVVIDGTINPDATTTTSGAEAMPTGVYVEVVVHEDAA